MTDISTFVGQIMSRNVLFAKPHFSFSEVARLFSEMKIHHLPVIDEDRKLVGIISANDVMRAYSRLLSEHSGDMAKVDTHLKVADLMTSEPVYVCPATSLHKAAELFNNHGIQCLPVVEGTEVKGIVTSRDLVRYFAER